MIVRNLTPHAVNLVVDGGQTVVFPAEGNVARLSASVEQVKSIYIDGLSVPVTRTVYGDITGLPDPEPGVVLIVSALVATRVKELDPARRDVMVPSESIRDSQGRIIGCRSLGWI